MPKLNLTPEQLAELKIEAQWQQHTERMGWNRHPVSEIQLRGAKIAFYAGWAYLLKIITEMVPHLPQNQGVDLLESYEADSIGFFNEILASLVKEGK